MEYLTAGAQEVFEGVQLGPLLGCGSYGRVHRGMWRGQHVAVKVRRATLLHSVHVDACKCPSLDCVVLKHRPHKQQLLTAPHGIAGNGIHVLCNLHAVGLIHHISPLCS